MDLLAGKVRAFARAKQVLSRNEVSNGGFSLFGELPYAGPCLSKG
jgi:hypothetical protein